MAVMGPQGEMGTGASGLRAGHYTAGGHTHTETHTHTVLTVHPPLLPSLAWLFFFFLSKHLFLYIYIS